MSFGSSFSVIFWAGVFRYGISARYSVSAWNGRPFSLIDCSKLLQSFEAIIHWGIAAAQRFILSYHVQHLTVIAKAVCQCMAAIWVPESTSLISCRQPWRSLLSWFLSPRLKNLLLFELQQVFLCVWHTDGYMSVWTCSPALWSHICPSAVIAL